MDVLDYGRGADPEAGGGVAAFGVGAPGNPIWGNVRNEPTSTMIVACFAFTHAGVLPKVPGLSTHRFRSSRRSSSCSRKYVTVGAVASGERVQAATDASTSQTPTFHPSLL
jgi:hypothetical protein